MRYLFAMALVATNVFVKILKFMSK